MSELHFRLKAVKVKVPREVTITFPLCVRFISIYASYYKNLSTSETKAPRMKPRIINSMDCMF